MEEETHTPERTHGKHPLGIGAESANQSVVGCVSPRDASSRAIRWQRSDHRFTIYFSFAAAALRPAEVCDVFPKLLPSGALGFGQLGQRLLVAHPGEVGALAGSPPAHTVRPRRAEEIPLCISPHREVGPQPFQPLLPQAGAALLSVQVRRRPHLGRSPLEWQHGRHGSEPGNVLGQLQARRRRRRNSGRTVATNWRSRNSACPSRFALRRQSPGGLGAEAEQLQILGPVLVGPEEACPEPLSGLVFLTPTAKGTWPGRSRRRSPVRYDCVQLRRCPSARRESAPLCPGSSWPPSSPPFHS